MIGEPYVTVTCDCCHSAHDFSLTATTRGGYDERDLENEMAAQGWVIDGDLTYCCQECADESTSGLAGGGR